MHETYWATRFLMFLLGRKIFRKILKMCIFIIIIVAIVGYFFEMQPPEANTAITGVKDAAIQFLEKKF